MTAMTVTGFKRRVSWFLINHVYAGTRHFERKRKLLQGLGHEIGAGTKIVGPVFCTGRLVIGEDCWIGKNLMINGNGTVVIGDRCDIAPEVTFQTGGHRIGTHERRAGEGITEDIVVGDGCWLGVRSTLLGGVTVKSGSVIAACACVSRDVEKDTLVGGIPATVIRKLSYD